MIPVYTHILFLLYKHCYFSFIVHALFLMAPPVFPLSFPELSFHLSVSQCKASCWYFAVKCVLTHFALRTTSELCFSVCCHFSDQQEEIKYRAFSKCPAMME